MWWYSFILECQEAAAHTVPIVITVGTVSLAIRIIFYTKFQCNLNTYHSTETWNMNAVTLKDSSTPLYEDVMRWGTGYLFFMLLFSPIVTSLLNLSQVKFMNPWFWYKRRAWHFNLRTSNTILKTLSGFWSHPLAQQ